MKNIKVWAIELFPGASLLCVQSLIEVAEMLAAEAEETLIDDYEAGDGITIKVREMTQGEFDNLPEWDGP